MRSLSLRGKVVKAAIRTFVSSVDRVLFLGRRPASPRLSGTYLIFDYDEALGFVVMNSALYEGIKRANPGCKVVVACGRLTFDALSANPYIDELIDLGDPIVSTSTALRRLLRWRFSTQTPPDVVLINCSMAKFAADILVVASGPTYRVGKGPIPIYDRTTESGTHQSVLEKVLARLNAVGIEDPTGLPRVYFNSKDLVNSQQLASGLLAGEKIRVGYVTQTSGGHPNNWWDNRFAEVADAIGSLTGSRAIFLGATADVAAIERIRNLMKTQSVSLAGRTNLRELAALISQCDIIVTLDTGTLHVTRGTGTPAVVIAPAHQPAYEWLPLNNANIKILRRDDIPCRECRLFYCSTRECMDQITSAEVVAAVAEMIQKKGVELNARDERARMSLSDWAPIGAHREFQN